MTHSGGCHCGQVRYEFDAPAEVEVHDCNCSICRRSGYLHWIIPKAQFRIITGEDGLSEYRFNTGVARHLFCSECGVKSFYVPRSHPDAYSVNLRCVDEGTVRGKQIIPFDGNHWEEAIDARRSG